MSDSDDIGKQSLSIVNKWKTLLIKKSENNHNPDDYKSKTKYCKKRENNENMKEIPLKKKCLSLTDYYKRNPDLGPKEKINVNKDDEFNSESGLSFLDSLTIKTLPKVRNNTILSKSQLNLSISNQLSRHKSNQVLEDNKFEEYDVCKKVPCQPKLYQPKKEIISEKYFDKSIKYPPSLLKQCQEVLFIYKEYIEEVLWTPRELLIHVLTKYNANQLANFEKFNPRFIEDNDELWKLHYINKHKIDNEYSNMTSISWRQKYMDADEYLEAKMAKSIIKLKTKMDHIVKETKSKTIKVLPAPRRNPSSGRFYKYGQDCSPATKKLRKQYQELFRYLR